MVTPLVDGLDEVRGYFTRYDDLLAPEVGQAIDLPQLRSSVAMAHKSYQAAQYHKTIGQLTLMLANVERAHRGVLPGSVLELTLGYVSAYVVAAKLLTKVGATDLALLAADRAANRAMESGSDLARGMSAYQIACALLRADRSDDAEHLAVAMAEQIEKRSRSDLPNLVSVAGSLWLIGAIIAARSMNRDEAQLRLDRAETLSGLLGEDANHAWTAFGPTNVQLHRISVATELGDAAEAVRLASFVDTSALPEGLTSRRAQVHLDLAWAQAQRKRYAEATLHLLEAERAAPEAVRYNVIVRELVREMLPRTGRGQTSALADLATRAACWTRAEVSAAKLGVLACGAPLAARVGDVRRLAQHEGWDVVLAVTAAAEQWIGDVLGAAPARDVTAQIVCPLTFNTASKWALGISDTPWMSVLNELLGQDVPIIAVPMVNENLWRHPSWGGTLSTLQTAGVELLDPTTGEPTARPVAHGSGAAIAAGFDPAWVLSRLRVKS